MTITLTGKEVEQRIQDMTDVVIGQLVTDSALAYRAKNILQSYNEDHAITGLRTMFARSLYDAIDRPVLSSNKEERLNVIAFMQSFTVKALDLVDWYQVVNFLASPEESEDTPFLSAKNLTE